MLASKEEACGREVVLPFLMGESADAVEHPENWSGKILSSISRTLGEQGIRLSLLNDSSTLDKNALPLNTIRLIESMPKPPAGVLMFAQPGLEAFRDWLKDRGIPGLTIGIPDNATTTNFVSTNFRELGRIAGVAFGSCGLDRVAYLYGDFHQLPSERQSLEGFCSGFAETTGRLPNALGFGYAAGSPQKFGREAMKNYLQRASEPPQAVFASGDYLAIGAIQALQEHGLRCPEDVVVVGTTGLDFAALTRPSITTIDQPMEALGRRAAEMLLQLSAQSDLIIPGVVLPPQVTFRESFPATADLVEGLQEEFPDLSITSTLTHPSAESAAEIEKPNCTVA